MGSRARRRNTRPDRGPGGGCGTPGGPAAPPRLERVREGGDGNCLFHAIARQALGDTRLAHRARAEVCNFMEEHLTPSAAAAGRSLLSESHRQMVQAQRAEVLSCGPSDDVVLRYVQGMRREGEWGTGLEALCAAYCYSRPVQVWSPTGYSELRPPASLLPPGNLEKPIRLLHNGHNHWDSALPSAAASGAAAAGDEANDDSVLALALSQSSLSADREWALQGPGVSLTLFDEDERAARRRTAAAAAEARQQRNTARGGGDRRRLTRHGQQESARKPPAPTQTGPSSGSIGHSSTSGGDAKAKDSKAGDCAVCADLGGESSMDGPLGESDHCVCSGPWARRRSARAAVAASPTDAAPAAKTATADLGSSDQHTASAAGSNQCLGYLDVLELENCIAALRGIGFTEDEAAEALARSDGEVERVKALYCIDWDASGRTLQLPFVDTA